MRTETFNENINDRHVKISRGSSKSNGGERDNPEISGIDNNGYLIIEIDGVKSILIPDEASSSSSSSESSSNDFLPARKVTFAKSSASEYASKDEEGDVSHESSKSIGGERKNLEISKCDNNDHLKALSHGHMSISPTVGPPVQVMDRSSEYDSYRIPSSVFVVNPNPMDWTNDSSDSDESLFSIQIGTHSLARDHLFTSPELHKSVELTKSSELNMFSPKPSVLIEDRNIRRKSVEIEDSKTIEMSDEDFKLEGSLDKNKNKVKNSHPAISYNSHGNGIEAVSNPIPTLPIEKNQKEPFCCLSWPSCSCLKCNLALCCCWHASPVLPEVKNHTFVKTESPQVTSDSTSNCCHMCQCFSWLRCTSCCSHTDCPHQLSYDKASEKTSSSTSNYCSWFQCYCSWSWSCCSWGKSGPQIDCPCHQSLGKASEETSSSTSNCFRCCS